MRARAMAIVLVVAALASACGGDDDESAPKGTATTPPTQNVAADRAVAEQAVLRLSDFPPGWQAQPHEESPDDPDLTRQLSECLRVDLALLEGEAGDASADSPDFESPNDQEVQSSVGLAPTSAKAQELFAVFERPETPGCLSRAVSQSIETELKKPMPGQQARPEVTVGQVSVNRASFPTIGDRTVAFRLTVPVQALGRALNVYADMVVALRGRAGTMLTFTDVGTPFPTDQAQKLTKTVVDRLPAA